MIKKLFFAIVVGLCALVTTADRQFAGGDGDGFDKVFAPTITLNEIKIECAWPDVAQSLRDDFAPDHFGVISLADLSDEICLRIETAAPASCPQTEIDQCVADSLAVFGL